MATVGQGLLPGSRSGAVEPLFKMNDLGRASLCQSLQKSCFDFEALRVTMRQVGLDCNSHATDAGSLRSELFSLGQDCATKATHEGLYMPMYI